MKEESSSSIYALSLEGGCFYIGRTKNLEARIKQHAESYGSKWTQLHPPLKPIQYETFASSSNYEEDMHVKEYMAKYGIDKVRGGSYILTELTDAERDFIQREIWLAQDRCIRCGCADHWVSKCPKAAFASPRSSPIKSNLEQTGGDGSAAGGASDSESITTCQETYNTDTDPTPAPVPAPAVKIATTDVVDGLCLGVGQLNLNIATLSIDLAMEPQTPPIIATPTIGTPTVATPTVATPTIASPTASRRRNGAMYYKRCHRSS
jgi:predicted GIY-YIG superfamily endonuclease